MNVFEVGSLWMDSKLKSIQIHFNIHFNSIVCVTKILLVDTKQLLSGVYNKLSVFRNIVLNK